MQCAHIMAMAVQRLHKGAQVGLPGLLLLWLLADWHAANARVVSQHPSCGCLQVTIGPWTERGFFYDFDMPQPLTERDLPKIRKEMQRILKKNLPFRREEVPAEEARRRIQASVGPLRWGWRWGKHGAFFCEPC